jgi:hypothetical protein
MLNETLHVTITDEFKPEIQKADGLSKAVLDFKISTPDELKNSAEFLKSLKASAKNIDEKRKEITRPIDDIKKRVMDFFRPISTQLSEAETTLKKAVLSYQREQERIRREAEQKAILAARAEEERKRKALEARAKKAAEKGQEEKAELLKEQAQEVYVPAVVQAPAVEKVAGISTRKNWTFRIKDLSKIPREYLIVDEKMLKKLAVASQGKISIPGVEFYQDESMSVRV